MIKLFVPLLVLVSPLVTYAQVNDDFSDGDFTSNPAWGTDNTSNWTVVNGQLRSNAAVASSTFYLSTPSAKAQYAQWEFFVNLQFNTSGLNYVDVYLTADQSNLLTAQGYYVRIGGTPDEISLFRTGSSTPIVDGRNGSTNKSNNTVKVKVTRSATSQWTLLRDTTGLGNTYFLEGTSQDNTFSTSSYFGFKITQSTASFHNKHFIDNVNVSDLVVDTSPPGIQDITNILPKQLNVLFSEKVEKTSAEIPGNYTVNNGVGVATAAALQPDEKTMQLSFLNAFVNGDSSMLTVTGIADLVGNVQTQESRKFFFFQPEPADVKDVIITEILADPSPPQKLPEAEYIELFNRSEKIFDLSGWKFRDGSTEVLLPQKLLYPQEYIVLLNASSSSAFAGHEHILPVAGFPAINNTGESLSLLDPQGLLIDSVNFSPEWHTDEDKEPGGWSLELIDLENTCAEESNWTSAEAPEGGTPGKQNSVFASKPDATGPKLLSAVPISSQQIKLIFDEKLEKNLPPIEEWKITPAISIESVVFINLSLREVVLSLSEALAANTLYEIEATSIRDCAGNSIQPAFSKAGFALPQDPIAGDVLINEVLFNPRPNGVDFVEVYNASDKFLNLKNWKLAQIENDVITKDESITPVDELFYPHTFKVLTVDGSILKNEYPSSKEETFIETTLPSMNDDEGSVVLTDAKGLALDYFLYNEKLHNALLKDSEGVSLERISLVEPSSNTENWHSAVKATGFATPGYANANRADAGVAGDVVVEPEIFEPINGQPNFTRIHYSLGQSGFVANAKIVDAQGRLIKQLLNNEILSPDGFFTWDGEQEDGTKARIGYYSVWMEVFDNVGTVRTFRKRVVVAGRLK
jgi:hypothetical protein